MRIAEIHDNLVYYIEIEHNDENRHYVRHNDTDWAVRMGESEEPVYDCVELEQLFQEYMKCQTKTIS